MKKKTRLPVDFLLMTVVLLSAFLVNLGLQSMFNTRTMIPMIFVLGVFLVSWWTQGYFWGITASLISVLAVNYAFTYPYWAFDLITPECVSSAVVMLIVATMTGALTTKLKAQEKMKAEAGKYELQFERWYDHYNHFYRIESIKRNVTKIGGEDTLVIV